MANMAAKISSMPPALSLSRKSRSAERGADLLDIEAGSDLF
jgi:hypothetical protein